MSNLTSSGGPAGGAAAGGVYGFNAGNGDLEERAGSAAENAAIGGARVGKFKDQGRRFDIRARLLAPQRERPEDIARLLVRTASGECFEVVPGFGYPGPPPPGTEVLCPVADGCCACCPTWSGWCRHCRCWPSPSSSPTRSVTRLFTSITVILRDR